MTELTHRLAIVRLAVLSIAVPASGCTGTLDEKYPTETSAGGLADAAACDESASSGHDGKHHAGEACLTCHSTSGGAPVFSIGGTLYGDLAGTGALPDATIHVIDAQGNDVAMTVAANGNFWSTASLAFPVETYASKCPDTREMLTPLEASGGDCNQAGCHATGFRASLP